MPLSIKQEVFSHLEVHEESYNDFLAEDSVVIPGHSLFIDLAEVEPWFESLYSKSGRYKEAENINRRVIKLCETVLGPEHPDTLTSIINLAGILNSQCKYEQAEEISRRMIGLRDKHLDTLTSMSNLAGVLYSQGKYEEAEKIGRHVMSLDTALWPEHPSTLTSIHCLAYLLKLQVINGWSAMWELHCVGR
jgi:tetratricopeptide (TPR) repeat protein